MWPLLLCSLIALAITIERFIFWFNLIPKHKAFLEQAFSDERWQPERLAELVNQNSSLPLARIFGSGLALRTDDQATLHLALESTARAEVPGLRRSLSVLDTIVTLSPLLGLLGTVIGLINSFASMGLTTGAASKGLEVAGGISEALIATATGMVVALGTLIFASLFRALARRQMSLIETATSQLELRWRLASAGLARTRS